MRKVLVDRELLELLRNFTFLHDDGCAGALRGNIDKALSAQPAEAEGVDFGFDDRSVKVSQEAYSIFLDRERHHLAALSAVTAERDRLREERDSQQRMCIAEMEKVSQLRAEVEDLRPIHAMILNALDRDAEEGKTARGEMAAELRAAMAAKEA